MFKSSIIVMSLNMVSRILGLIREIMMAYFFGSTGYTDAYFASTRIANLFTTLLGEGSLGTVFIPLYKQKQKEYGDEGAKNFLYSIIMLVFEFTLTIAFITCIFSKQILKYLIRFEDGSRMNMADSMLKIMAFYIIFISLSGIASSLLNSYSKFLISTSVAIVFNITLILGIYISGKTIGIYLMAYVFLLSGLLQLLIQLPEFFKIVGRIKFKIDLKDPFVKEFFIMMLPTLVGIFAYQINELIDTSFAALLTEGTISAINYASRLYLLPIGVFAISLSVVIFPELSDAVVHKNIDKEKAIFLRGLNLLSFLIIPSMFGLFFYSEDIIRLIYSNGGRFSNDSVVMTSQILKCYALGLLFFATNHLLSREHFVHKNRKTTVYASIIAICINVLLDYLLYKPYAHIGLTMATSISALVNYIILLTSVRINYIKFSLFKYMYFGFKVILSSIIALILSYTFNHIIIKIFTFIVIYFIIWAYTFYKKRFKIFD